MWSTKSRDMVDDVRTDAQARDSEAVAPPTVGGEVLRWYEGDPTRRGFYAVDIKGNTWHWWLDREWAWWSNADTTRRLAERLAAVEAEVAARVERAYREGHGTGFALSAASGGRASGNAGPGWLASRSRAELEAK